MISFVNLAILPVNNVVDQLVINVQFVIILIPYIITIAFKLLAYSPNIF